MARVMAWCGWQVEGFDKSLGDDLTQTHVSDRASSAVASSQAYWIALQCSTWSRAREIPAGSNAPRPLRSEDEPWGLADGEFTPAEREQLEEANELITNCMEFCKIGDLEGSLGTIENPGRSLLFDVEEVQKLSDPARGAQAWQEVRYDNCAQGGIRSKDQMLITSSQLLADALQDSVCRHTHHPNEWRSVEAEQGHRAIWATREASTKASLPSMQWCR